MPSDIPPPLVDVLIPVYNAEAYVHSAISSIQQQSVRDIVIHLVDDGSTDGTPDILKAIAEKDYRVRVYTQTNAGIVSALNRGLEHCTAPLIARHDADDLAAPHRFAAQIRTLERAPNLVATAGAAKHIGATGEDLGTRTHLRDPARSSPYAFPAREPYLLHPFLMVRRRALTEVGGYRHVVHAEDSDLYWRLAEAGHLHNDTAELGSYRMHAESISSRSVENGRVLSLSSQLAALSAVRRRERRPDFVFSPELARSVRAGASSLERLCGLVAGAVTRAEMTRLRLAVACKLLEVAGYRPFELTSEDCQFFDDAYRAGAHLIKDDSLRTLQRMIAGTGVRLASIGRSEDGWRIGRHNVLGFAARRAARAAMPTGLSERFRRW